MVFGRVCLVEVAFLWSLEDVLHVSFPAMIVYQDHSVLRVLRESFIGMEFVTIVQIVVMIVMIMGSVLSVNLASF